MIKFTSNYNFVETQIHLEVKVWIIQRLRGESLDYLERERNRKNGSCVRNENIVSLKDSLSF